MRRTASALPRLQAVVSSLVVSARQVAERTSVIFTSHKDARIGYVTMPGTDW